MKRKIFSTIFISFFLATCLLDPVEQPAWPQSPNPSPFTEPAAVQLTQNTAILPLYEVFEITLAQDHRYMNPFFDVTITVDFISPGGRSISIGGFYYGPADHAEGSPGTETWKARFAPAEAGEWAFAYRFEGKGGIHATGSGKFTAVKGKNPQPGFVRRHPTNPFRWIFENGEPYHPIGVQDCWGDNNDNGSVLDQASMEGPFRLDAKKPAPMPPGPLFIRGPANNPQNGDVYFRQFARAGFNLYRFSQQNCSFSLMDGWDHYLVKEARMADELLRRARKYGFRILYGLFGYQPVFNENPGDPAGMEQVKRFTKYSVDRWGAYVDFWEFLNEQKASDQWYAAMAPYLRSIDPYRHPITTSWEHPELPGIEINAPHWYQNENELESDRIIADRAQEWKRFNKPVIVDEQGNYIDTQQPIPPGVGGVWDERSALRMRIRCWTAFFNEIAFVFWNTSYARDGHFMNIWLGPKEREYVHALQSFAGALGGDLRMVPVTVSAPGAARAYGLASSERTGVYLHHFGNHTEPLKGLKITMDIPRAATGYWYVPETAAIAGTIAVATGANTIDVPEFIVDLALLITPGPAPDIDGDGVPNGRDTDNDEDGIANAEDAFPLETEEWADQDADWIGDNQDADDNGDGTGDDINRNGTPDFQELDFDGDGVDQANAIPWDAFPWNPAEWRDTDSDGTGDNADLDDDGDGWSDAEEHRAGTDLLNVLSFPVNSGVSDQLNLVKTEPPKRLYPQPKIPVFWKSTVEDVAAAVNAVQRGSGEIIAYTPGGRPVYKVSYGQRADFHSQANYNSAAGAGDPAFYARKAADTPPVVFLIGPVHGQEVEGVAGMVNLLRVAETGKDWRDKAWPDLRAALDRCRVVIVPLPNPDGRARCPYDSFIGLSGEEMTRIGQGTRKDGTLYRWPGVKAIHPMRGDVGFLGAYFNDAGINLMHDEFFAPMAEETRALLNIALDEAPDYILNLHSHESPPAVLPTSYAPFYTKETIARFGERLMARYRNAGLPAGEPPVPAGDGKRYPPPSFNLTSALHHVCGGVSMTFECSHGVRDAGYPQVTHDQILDIQLILYEELLAFALETPRPVLSEANGN
ncbi:MAG: DUF5060 domain-containing protein [bacterium]